MAEVDVQRQQLEELIPAEIVLGVFSHNSDATIGHIVRSGQEALATYFPGSHSVLVNLDGDFHDGIPTRAQEAAINKSSFLELAYPVSRLAIEHYGMPGKAAAYQALFSVAEKLQSRVCAVVDGNISTFSGEWVEALVRPVFEQEFDLVSPCYLRHKYDAPILNGIVYPFTRALYGKRIRQPIGGDFAFSGKLIDHLMRQPQFESITGGFSVDAWISMRACSGDFRLAQAYLGPRTLHQQDPVPEVSAILQDVLGAIFTEMDETASVWQRIRGSEPVPSFGSGCEPVEDPDPTPFDVHPMIDSFRLGFQNLQDIWRIVLSPGTLVELKRMTIGGADTFRFDDAVWARVIYDFALAHRLRIIDRTHLLRALTPIYLGWLAAYAISVRDKNAKETQDRIEALCLAYETQKGYFISRWRWPDRFNP